MERLEEISDENLFWFYHEELEMIDRGSSPKIIPVNVRRRLVRLGILEYGRGLDKTSGLVLTPKGRALLDSYGFGGTGGSQEP
jgi:hypothetical protein